jgi:hypothetical protein
MSEQATKEAMTLQEALLLASVETDEPADRLHLALKILGQEYHKQSLFIVRQGLMLRKLQRSGT